MKTEKRIVKVLGEHMTKRIEDEGVNLDDEYIDRVVSHIISRMKSKSV